MENIKQEKEERLGAIAKEILKDLQDKGLTINEVEAVIEEIHSYYHLSANKQFSQINDREKFVFYEVTMSERAKQILEGKF